MITAAAHTLVGITRAFDGEAVCGAGRMCVIRSAPRRVFDASSGGGESRARRTASRIRRATTPGTSSSSQVHRATCQPASPDGVLANFSAPHHVRRDLSVGDQPAVLAAAVELAHDSALLEQEVHTSQMIAVGRVEVGLTLGDRQLLAQHQPGCGIRRRSRIGRRVARGCGERAAVPRGVAARSPQQQRPRKSVPPRGAHDRRRRRPARTATFVRGLPPSGPRS